jgi:dynein assembly factor 3, axonemal
MRERQEMFLDLYANSMIRDKTQRYLEGVVKELIQLVTEDDRCKSVIKSIIDFDQLRFKDRDEMEEVMSTYLKKHAFDMEKLRDQRLRHHFADRYDFRRNAVDWDYQYGIRLMAPHCHQQEYRDWRLNGIGFETRLTVNNIPNRTLSSFIPGKKKKSGDSIMIRGYWGDIINSPFVTFGFEVLNEEDREKFFRKLNYQRIYVLILSHSFPSLDGQ